MRNAKVRIALLAVLVLGALTLPAAADASYPAYYNCVLKPSNQWCDGQANGTYAGLHSWDYNQAWYPGAWDNTVTACQRVWKPSSGGVLSGSSCAPNMTWSYYGDVQCACYEAEAKQISGGAHSINGYTDADYF